MAQYFAGGAERSPTTWSRCGGTFTGIRSWAFRKPARPASSPNGSGPWATPSEPGSARPASPASLRAANPGKTVLLRADIDALPILEQADVAWKSESPGVMHACGHDAHTAMGLAAAEILAKEAPSLAGNLCLRVPACRGAPDRSRGDAQGRRAGGGDAGRWLRRPRHEPLARRHRGDLDGAVMTSADKLSLTVTGRGGHGANPHSADRPDRGRRPDRHGAPDAGEPRDASPASRPSSASRCSRPVPPSTSSPTPWR